MPLFLPRVYKTRGVYLFLDLMWLQCYALGRGEVAPTPAYPNALPLTTHHGPGHW